MPATATQESVEATIFKELARLGPEPESVERDITFSDLGIDSLDLVEVAQLVEDEYGVILKGEDMEKLATVGDAIDLVVARAES